MAQLMLLDDQSAAAADLGLTASDSISGNRPGFSSSSPSLEDNAGNPEANTRTFLSYEFDPGDFNHVLSAVNVKVSIL